MKREKKSKRNRYTLGNRGSTFIVVMVAMSFLAVLGTIIISVSAANIQMKNQEHVSKRNFYTDEMGLDDIYHGIGQVAAESLSQAYTEVLARSSTDGTSLASTSYTDQEAAYQAFSIRFIDKLIAEYGDDGEKLPDTLSDLGSYITKPDPATDPGTNPGIFVNDFDGIEIINENGIPFQYIFKNVEVTFETTDRTGAAGDFISSITTDIVIEVPYVNFFQDSSRILEYAMVANDGIYFNGGTVEVAGNIYAGVDNVNPEDLDFDELRDMQLYHGAGSGVSDAETGVYGGLNFYNSTVTFNSNYLVTKGDMNLRASTVTIGSSSSVAQPQIWAESIRTLQKQDRWAGSETDNNLTIDGDIYVANDLELNAENSHVTLSGNYFGYNAGDYRTWESKGLLAAKYTDTQHTEQSSMIINGNGSELNIGGLDTLVLAGRAYVDMADRPTGESYNLLPGSGLEEQVTGESLALRVNQYIYLAPSQYLTVPNPVKLDDISSATDDVWKEDSTGRPIAFFGSIFSVSDTNPVIGRNMIDRETGDVYRYYYLNFNNNASRMREYAEFIMNMPDIELIKAGNVPTELNDKYKYTSVDISYLEELWEIKTALQARIGLSDIEVSGIDSIDNIHTLGSVVNVSGGTITSPIIPAGQQLAEPYVSNIRSSLLTHYISLYTSLDPQEGFSLLNPVTTLDNKYKDAYTLGDTEELPAQVFVDFKGDNIPIGLAAATLSPTIFAGYRDTSNQRLVTNSSVTLSMSNCPSGSFSGIILSAGDVIIDKINVNGMIITTGKIYVYGNSRIVADRGAVQSILDEEMRLESARGPIADTNPTADYALTYMRGINLSTTVSDYTDRIRGTDYVDYISYANWRKGEKD